MRAHLLLPLLLGCAGDPTTDSAASAGATDDADGQDGGDGADGADGGDGGDGASALDDQLRAMLAAQDPPLSPLTPPDGIDPQVAALGSALFYDPVLSGNKDISCATCHHPTLGTGDRLWLSVGTGGVGLGPERATGEDPAFVPRHALDLFNRGDAAWHTLFWDGRVQARDGRIATPLGADLPDGLDGVLAAQALFPLLDRAEMLGQPGDVAADGAPNELAAHDDPAAVFDGIVARIAAISAYDPLFEAAWPDLAPADRGIQHVANALAAYQATAFAFTDTPYDRYLAGDDDALDDAQKLGALVFFGDGQCAACHNGPLLTDQQVHVTGVPQLGPGMPDHAPFDPGGFAATGDDADRFAFRTPPLRNVALTAPYMHDGAYPDLESAVLHYGSPEDAARTYDDASLHAALRDTVQRDEDHLSDLEARLSPDLPTGDATTVGLSNVRAFLEGLTDPAAADLLGACPRLGAERPARGRRPVAVTRG